MQVVQIDTDMLEELKRYPWIESDYERGKSLWNISKRLENEGFIAHPYVIGMVIEAGGHGLRKPTKNAISKWKRILGDLITHKEEIESLYVDRKMSPDMISRKLKSKYDFYYSGNTIKSFLKYYCRIGLRTWKEGISLQKVLTPDEEKKIYNIFSGGNLTKKAIAEKYEVSEPTISNAIKRAEKREEEEMDEVSI